jgi:uncharacterized protein with von Willebrand factor type A (vWA) domain
MYPFASLPENVAAFCRTLRHRHGFRIGSGELHDAARAFDIVDPADEQAVRHALRTILCSSVDDVAVFDRAFTAFFFPGPTGVPQDQTPSTRREPGSGADGPEADGEPARPPRPTSAGTDPADTSEPGGGPMTPLDAPDGAVEEAALFALSSYSPLDADAAGALELPPLERPWSDAARSFVRRLHLSLARRWRPADRGRRFDLRRTLRASLQTGGEALTARWLRRPRLTARFVLLVDGSRSMSGHARTALQIGVAMASVTSRVEVFAFSTKLRRVTHEVRRAASGEAARLGGMHHAWAGGTVIGGCVRDFLQRFGERMVGRDTVVMIASDGLDVGASELLRDAMRELHRRSAGVIWLNPLLETPGYEPIAGGMRAARPFVDTFASVNDVAAFARLARGVRLRA